jgi:hypothetical protein
MKTLGNSGNGESGYERSLESVLDVRLNHLGKSQGS